MAIERHGCSERFACRVFGQSRSTQRRRPRHQRPDDPDRWLREESESDSVSSDGGGSYIASLSEAERLEYQEQQERCFEEANIGVARQKQEFVGEMPARVNDLLAGLEQGSTAEMLAAADDWYSCMVQEGFDFESRSHALNFGESEIVEILGLTEESDYEPAASQTSEAREFEGNFFGIERGCWTKTYLPVIESHLSELDDLLAEVEKSPLDIFED